MSERILLLEHYTPEQSQIVVTESKSQPLWESKGIETIGSGTDMFLEGVVMQAEVLNRNGRRYPLNEMVSAVQSLLPTIREFGGVFGELDHPADRLTVYLKETSHAIVDLRMDGNNVMGKMKLLETPMGDLARGLVKSKIRFGVSSRGSGMVNESVVSNFNLQTIDLVATPSAQGAYPVPVTEALNMAKHPEMLKEMLHTHRHDPIAQKYIMRNIEDLAKEMIRALGQK
jgi:hypothetical protein